MAFSKTKTPEKKGTAQVITQKGRASGLNKVMIIGHLGQDPELKAVGESNVLNMSVATSESWVDKKTGELQEKTEWHRITVWGKLAETCAEYLHKGSKVYVEGKLQTRTYEKDDETRYATEILANSVQFLSPRNQENN